MKGKSKEALFAQSGVSRHFKNLSFRALREANRNDKKLKLYLTPQKLKEPVKRRANFINGLTYLYEATFDTQWLEAARHFAKFGGSFRPECGPKPKLP